MENDNQPRANFWVDEQLVSEASLVSNCEKNAEAASGNQTEISTVRSSQSQNSRKRKISESSCEPGMQNVFFFSSYSLTITHLLPISKGRGDC